MTSKKMFDTFLRKYSTTSRGGGFNFSKENSQTSTIIKVPWNNFVPFWTDYCEKYTSSPGKLESQQLYEENKSETTLRFTLQFEFTKKVKEELPVDFLINFIRTIVFENLQLDSAETLICVSISQGTKYYIIDYTFPAIRVDKDFFNSKIVSELCKHLQDEDARKELPSFRGDWNQVVLPLSDYTPLYGCKFSKDNPALKFIGVWQLSGDEIEEPIEELFSPDLHSLFQSHCKASLPIDLQDNIRYLPIIYSSMYSDTVVHPKIDDSGSKFSPISDISSSIESDMVYHLLPLISKRRYENPMYNWQIGRCLYNIFNGENSGLDLWNSYSKKNSKDNTDAWEVEFPTNTGVNDYLSSRTIGYFAKIDDPDGYQEWHTAWMAEAVFQSFDKIEIKVAEVMYRLLWLDFLTVGKSEWYSFRPGGTRLIRSISNVEFRRKFPDVMQFYSKVLSENSHDISSVAASGIGRDLDKPIDKNKAIGEIIRSLGKNAYQNAIERHCFVKFYRIGIENFFDSNPALTSWGNIVSEVHEDKIYARDGKMEDFLTRGSDITYNERTYTWDHPKIKELMYWFKTAFVDEDLISCFIKICCSFLYGRNKEKAIYAFCGPSGDNSKSMMDKLLKGVFSVYAIDFPVYVLTDSKQNSGGPTPELAQAQAARLASVAEPDGNIPFQGSLCKRYSGGDTFFARGCGKDGGSFIPMFKMIIYCNAIPNIEDADEATQRRLKYIPFESKYCDDAPEDISEQFRLRRFPKDPNFEEKIKTFRRPMLWILMNYYEQYCAEGINPPKIVQEYTQRYWNENDPYKLFVEENIIITKSNGDKLSATNIYKVFKMWYTTNFNSRARKYGVPEVSNMTRHLNAIFGDQVNRVWSGVRLRTPDNEKKFDIE